MGSDFTGTLCQGIAELGLPESAVHKRLSAWPGIADNSGDAVALRLTGALHRLVLDGADPDLASVYPPHSVDPGRLLATVHAAIVRHDAFISAYLNSPPQTNEIGRSAMLLPAFLWLAARHPAEFEVLELGASAGLNQNLDRYCVDYGTWRAGDPASSVRIACEWRSGGIPEWAGAPVSIIGRSGCDIEPVAIQTDSQRKRLRSYVWPDQALRLARLEAALELARAHPPRIERSGAADWLAGKNAPGAAHGKPSRHHAQRDVAIYARRRKGPRRNADPPPRTARHRRSALVLDPV